MNNYYNTREVSKILGLTIKTIQKLIRNKHLIAYRVSNHYLIADTDLKLFIESKKV